MEHSSASLYDLWSVSGCKEIKQVPRAYFTETFECTKQNNEAKCVISRLGDLCAPKTLTIKLEKCPFPKNDIIERLEKLSIKFRTGDCPANEQELFSCDLKFLMAMDKNIFVESRGDEVEYVIDLSLERFLGLIKLVAVSYVETQLVIGNIGDLYEYADFTVDVKLCNCMSKERRMCATQTREDDVQSIYKIDCNLKITEPNNNGQYCEYESIANMKKYLTKGMFLLCDSIERLKELHIYHGGLDRFVFKRSDLMKYCNIISRQLIYVPFNDQKNWEDRTPESFVGGIISRKSASNIIEPIFKMSFKFDRSLNPTIPIVAIYPLYYNTVSYVNGFCVCGEELKDETKTLEELCCGGCPQCAMERKIANGELYPEMSFAERCEWTATHIAVEEHD